MPESAASPSIDPTVAALRWAFGQRLRGLRKKAEMTQAEVAAAASRASHVTRSYYAEIEGGHRNVSLDKISAIAGALGVTVGELFVGLHSDSPAGAEQRSDP